MPSHAHIRYDADGTCDLTITATGRLSAQLFDSGKALIKVYDPDDNMLRAIHIRRAYLIDVDYRPNPEPQEETP